MNDEAFLDLIQATPDDPCIRLIYADWLEDQSDARAEFIRTDEEMRSLPMLSGRYWDLALRREELRSTCDEGWLKRISVGRETRTVDAPLQPLLKAVWDHNLPLGPFGDPEVRDRAERAWQDSLTAEDCLALLTWLLHPIRPIEWHEVIERYIPALLHDIGRHLGLAGRRLQDGRILDRLIRLLRLRRCRYPALLAIEGIGDSRAFEAVLACLGDRACHSQLSGTLAAIMTPEQVVRVREMVAQQNLARESQRELQEALQEYEIRRAELANEGRNR